MKKFGFRRGRAVAFAATLLAALRDARLRAGEDHHRRRAAAGRQSVLYRDDARHSRARRELGWDVVTVSSNEDKLKQINGVQDLVARGVKGILISPIDAVGVNAAYDAAAAGKVPIVSVARGSTSPNQTIHVAMDEKQIGRDIAEWTAQEARRQRQGRDAARTERRADVPQSRPKAITR